MQASLHTSSQVLSMHIEPPRTYISCSFSVLPQTWWSPQQWMKTCLQLQPEFCARENLLIFTSSTSIYSGSWHYVRAMSGHNQMHCGRVIGGVLWLIHLGCDMHGRSRHGHIIKWSWYDLGQVIGNLRVTASWRLSTPNVWSDSKLNTVLVMCQ